MIGSVFGLVFCAPISAGLNWGFRALVRPLEVPAFFAQQRQRDRWMTFLVFLCGMIHFLGMLILLICYIVFITRHVRERREAQARGVPVALPYIPQFSLGDLMVMAFSFGLFPLLVGQVVSVASISEQMRPTPEVMQGVHVLTLTLGGMLFPMAFLSGLTRLNSHRVPQGRARAAFLFIYPYLPVAEMAACVSLLVLLSAAAGNAKGDTFWIIGVVATASIGTLVLGVSLAKTARNAAEAEAMRENLSRATQASAASDSGS
ncbi:MAG TPA: hypothetical protein VGP72_01075 [Planctomycetota bacterium]